MADLGVMDLGIEIRPDRQLRIPLFPRDSGQGERSNGNTGRGMARATSADRVPRGRDKFRHDTSREKPANPTMDAGPAFPRSRARFRPPTQHVRFLLSQPTQPSLDRMFDDPGRPHRHGYFNTRGCSTKENLLTFALETQPLLQRRPRKNGYHRRP